MNSIDIMVFALSIPALWLMGKKKKSCFFIFLVVNILMIILCLATVPRLWGVMGMQFVYMGFNVRNFILWKKSEEDSECEKYIH
jgi:nicotinamide riboside transporter PnuC